MKAQYFPARWLVLVAVLALIGVSCAEHDHSTHEHQSELATGVGDGHGGDHGEQASEGAEFDHHGNPIHDDLFYEEIIENGVKVEFTMQSFLGIGGRGSDLASEIVEGANSAVIFRLSDESGRPMTDVVPFAWLDTAAASAASCESRVAGYLSGALTERPLMDFNGFFLLALNRGPTISVIDPNVDVAGYTQLFTVMSLTGPGRDWAQTEDGSRMVVTIPSTNQVAVADLETFEVIGHMPSGTNPDSVAIAPDGLAWVTNDAIGQGGGVTVIDPTGMTMVASVSTGDADDLAFSKDGSLGYLVGDDTRTVAAVSVSTHEVTSSVEIDQPPTEIAVAGNGDVYVAGEAMDEILVLDATLGDVRARIPTGPGTSDLAVSPDGRWVFAARTAYDEVAIIDTESRETRYVVPVPGGPDQISFSDTSAYVRARHAPQMTSVPLDALAAGTTLAATTLPVGQEAPGAVPDEAEAPALLAGPGTVFVANPADDKIHYYPEGATAASGSFQGHGLVPRAVEVVDRSIRQTAPGVYTGPLRIPAAGVFQVALLIDSPRVIHCFEFEANPTDVELSAATRPVLTLLNESLEATPGEPFVVELGLTEGDDGELIPDATDVTVVINKAGGNWTERAVAQHVGAGRYEVIFTVPDAGAYQLFFSVPSLGIDVNSQPAPFVRTG